MCLHPRSTRRCALCTQGCGRRVPTGSEGLGVTPQGGGGECCGTGTAALRHSPARRAGRNTGSAPQPQRPPSPGALKSFVRRLLTQTPLGSEVAQGWRASTSSVPPGQRCLGCMDNPPLKVAASRLRGASTFQLRDGRSHFYDGKTSFSRAGREQRRELGCW